MNRQWLSSALLLLTLFQSAVVVWGDFVVPAQHPVFVGYIDPIISPGGQSAHQHDIFGAQLLDQNTENARQLKRSQCTTAYFRGDKSAWWFPSVYAVNPQTNRMIRPVSTSSVYYLFRQTNYNLSEIDLSPMVNGLKVVMGAAGETDPNRDNIRFGCAVYLREGTNLRVPTPQFRLRSKIDAAKNCVQISVRYLLPSCWDGKNLDSVDHISHLAFPERRTRKCPASHPKPIPTLHVNQDVFLPFPLSWEANAEYLPFFFSNGQPNMGMAKHRDQAYGAHVDYFGAWEQSSLSLLSSTCYQYATHDHCGLMDQRLSQIRPEVLRKEYDSAAAIKCFNTNQQFQLGSSLPLDFPLMRDRFPTFTKPDYCYPTPNGEMCWKQESSTGHWSREKVFKLLEPQLGGNLYPLYGSFFGIYDGMAYADRKMDYNVEYAPWIQHPGGQPLRLWYAYRNGKTGLALSVQDGAVSNGVPTVQIPFRNETSQQWTVSTVPETPQSVLITNVRSGKCVDVDSMSLLPGAPVIQWDCHRNLNQRWIPRSVVRKGLTFRQFQSIHSQMCLSIRGDQTAIVQEPCNNGNDAQLWRPEVVAVTV